MFATSYSLNKQSAEVYLSNGRHDSNWEADIHDVSIESCHYEEDPLGFRVVFYKDLPKALKGKDDCYSIGASHLKSRLDALWRAGFDAPMTKKAMNMIDQQRINGIKRRAV